MKEAKTKRPRLRGVSIEEDIVADEWLFSEEGRRDECGRECFEGGGWLEFDRGKSSETSSLMSKEMVSVARRPKFSRER
jgi:hypothetical protein